jgi:hypothetical protein
VNMKVMGFPEYDNIYMKSWFIRHLQDQEIVGYLSSLDITVFTWR